MKNMAFNFLKKFCDKFNEKRNDVKSLQKLLYNSNIKSPVTDLLENQSKELCVILNKEKQSVVGKLSADDKTLEQIDNIKNKLQNNIELTTKDNLSFVFQEDKVIDDQWNTKNRRLQYRIWLDKLQLYNTFMNLPLEEQKLKLKNNYVKNTFVSLLIASNMFLPNNWWAKSDDNKSPQYDPRQKEVLAQSDAWWFMESEDFYHATKAKEIKDHITTLQNHIQNWSQNPLDKSWESIKDVITLQNALNYLIENHEKLSDIEKVEVDWYITTWWETAQTIDEIWKIMWLDLSWIFTLSNEQQINQLKKLFMQMIPKQNKMQDQIKTKANKRNYINIINQLIQVDDTAYSSLKKQTYKKEQIFENPEKNNHQEILKSIIVISISSLLLLYYGIMGFLHYESFKNSVATKRVRKWLKKKWQIVSGKNKSYWSAEYLYWDNKDQVGLSKYFHGNENDTWYTDVLDSDNSNDLHAEGNTKLSEKNSKIGESNGWEVDYYHYNYYDHFFSQSDDEKKIIADLLYMDLSWYMKNLLPSNKSENYFSIISTIINKHNINIKNQELAKKDIYSYIHDYVYNAKWNKKLKNIMKEINIWWYISTEKINNYSELLSFYYELFVWENVKQKHDLLDIASYCFTILTSCVNDHNLDEREVTIELCRSIWSGKYTIIWWEWTIVKRFIEEIQTTNK